MQIDYSFESYWCWKSDCNFFWDNWYSAMQVELQLHHIYLTGFKV